MKNQNKTNKKRPAKLYRHRQISPFIQRPNFYLDLTLNQVGNKDKLNGLKTMKQMLTTDNVHQE